jgi:hypothetical protein
MRIDSAAAAAAAAKACDDVIPLTHFGFASETVSGIKQTISMTDAQPRGS